ncbi:MAG: AMP-binding protein [Chloroflexi bacterium]|nr:AMP-binding protein [Chloroflexota bacterium]
MARPTRFTPEFIEQNIRNGVWELTTFADVWDRNARYYPDKEALVDESRRLTWAQAKEWTDNLALGFREMGLQKDDPVVIQLPNSVELCLVRQACEKAGLVFLPVLRSYRHKEIKQFLAMTGAVGIIIPSQYRGFDYVQMVRELRGDLPALRHIFVVGEEAPEGTVSVEKLARQTAHRRPVTYLQQTRCPPTEFSMILPTSGTTGFPKLSENPIMTIMVRERACVRNLKLTGDDVFGIFTPAPGGANGRSYYSAPLVGAKAVMLEHWEPEKGLQLIEKERITVLPLVPTQIVQMIRHPNFDRYDVSSLRLVLCMGAVLPYSVGVEAESKFTGARIIQNYSGVGCSVGCMGDPDADRETRLLTVGKPYAGAKLKLVDDSDREVARGEIGEVMLSGPGGDSGYYRDPEGTRQVWTEDGWFRMGDLGKLDERGNLMIVGRKKDMIIRGGQNIYPSEIEAILVKHPAVADVAIVAMPDPVMGEKACAYVAPKPGKTLTLEDIVAFLRSQNIVPYKLPERLELREKLPTVADGQKTDKKALQQEISRMVAP